MAETIPKTKRLLKTKKRWNLEQWTVPKIWPDSTVYIIGGGPSVSDTPLHLIHDKHVIGVNNAYKLGDWIDVCWFGDFRWFEWNHEDLIGYKGMLVTCQRRLRNINGHDIKSLLKIHKSGITQNPKMICWNGSSGGSAINLAYHFGAKRIVLIGFDMQSVNGKYNYHSDYPEKRTAINPYLKFLSAFSGIKKAADKLGVQILNATPNSKIEEFQMVNLEDV